MASWMTCKLSNRNWLSDKCSKLFTVNSVARKQKVHLFIFNFFHWPTNMKWLHIQITEIVQNKKMLYKLSSKIHYLLIIIMNVTKEESTKYRIKQIILFTFFRIALWSSERTFAICFFFLFCFFQVVMTQWLFFFVFSLITFFFIFHDRKHWKNFWMSAATVAYKHFWFHIRTDKSEKLIQNTTTYFYLLFCYLFLCSFAISILLFWIVIFSCFFSQLIWLSNDIRINLYSY